ncbi:hypothetical protein [Mycobacterium sp. PS03-16]|uniref:hypothetical protein n=1 Tax=Mycobacterium sp. PS03-16 TaxID=2559611 RepID=UPI001ADDB03B|nr:hypothetical protein [Mycobacterium sp. PS03-16]
MDQAVIRTFALAYGHSPSQLPPPSGRDGLLFPRAFDFELVEWARNKAYLCGRYRLVRARS